MPSVPTSTISVSGAPVVGSYSTGGHTTRPSAPRMPEHPLVPQRRQEGADDRPGGPHEAVLDDERRVEQITVCGNVVHVDPLNVWPRSDPELRAAD